MRMESTIAIMMTTMTKLVMVMTAIAIICTGDSCKLIRRLRDSPMWAKGKGTLDVKARQ